MPLYEYRCTACGRRTTALLATWSAPDPACPHCGKQSLERLVSTFATVRSEEASFEGGDDDFEGGGEFDDDGGGFGGDDDDW